MAFYGKLMGCRVANAFWCRLQVSFRSMSRALMAIVFGFANPLGSPPLLLTL